MDEFHYELINEWSWRYGLCVDSAMCVHDTYLLDVLYPCQSFWIM